MTRTGGGAEEIVTGGEASVPVRAGPLARRRLYLGGTLLVLLAVFAYTLPVGEWLEAFTRYVRELGFWGPALYVLAYTVTTVLFVPGTILTVPAGVIFGPWLGTVVVALGSALGAGFGFLIGRHLARGHVEAWIRRRPRFQSIDEAVAQEGWKIVFLLRLSPLLPYNFLNYAFGLTKIPFWNYLLASLAGVLPSIVMYVFGGTAAAELIERSGANWQFWLSLLAVLLGTAWVTQKAAQAVRRAR